MRRLCSAESVRPGAELWRAATCSPHWARCGPGASTRAYRVLPSAATQACQELRSPRTPGAIARVCAAQSRRRRPPCEPHSTLIREPVGARIVWPERGERLDSDARRVPACASILRPHARREASAPGGGAWHRHRPETPDRSAPAAALEKCEVCRGDPVASVWARLCLRSSFPAAGRGVFQAETRQWEGNWKAWGELAALAMTRLVPADLGVPRRAGEARQALRVGARSHPSGLPAPILRWCDRCGASRARSAAAPAAGGVSRPVLPGA